MQISKNYAFLYPAFSRSGKAMGNALCEAFISIKSGGLCAHSTANAVASAAVSILVQPDIEDTFIRYNVKFPIVLRKNPALQDSCAAHMTKVTWVAVRQHFSCSPQSVPDFSEAARPAGCLLPVYAVILWPPGRGTPCRGQAAFYCICRYSAAFLANSVVTSSS